MKRRRVNRAERVEPTPETLSKLTSDPLEELLRTSWGHLRADAETINRQQAAAAANEILVVHNIALQQLSGKGMRFDEFVDPGKREMPDWVSKVFSLRLTPWTREVGSKVARSTIDLIVDRREPAQPAQIAFALLRYARRMR